MYLIHALLLLVVSMNHLNFLKNTHINVQFIVFLDNLSDLPSEPRK